VERETARAKQMKEDLEKNNNLEARLSGESSKKFLGIEEEQDLMLLEEAEKLLVRKSKEADRAREAKAVKDWEELQK
jgi:Xaa-Pro aminopeptidase